MARLNEMLRVLLPDEGVSFQVAKTFKASNDPDFGSQESGILELYAIADGAIEPEPGGPTVVICMDEFEPLNLQPHCVDITSGAPQSLRHCGSSKAAPRIDRSAQAWYKEPMGFRRGGL